LGIRASPGVSPVPIPPVELATPNPKKKFGTEAPGDDAAPGEFGELEENTDEEGVEPELELPDPVGCSAGLTKAGRKGIRLESMTIRFPPPDTAMTAG